MNESWILTNIMIIVVPSSSSTRATAWEELDIAQWKRVRKPLMKRILKYLANFIFYKFLEHFLSEKTISTKKPFLDILNSFFKLILFSFLMWLPQHFYTHEIWPIWRSTIHRSTAQGNRQLPKIRFIARAHLYWHVQHHREKKWV